MGAIPDDLCTFIITLTEFIEWEMFQTKVLEKINSHILCSITVFWKLWHLWDSVKNMVEPDMPQMTYYAEEMWFACWAIWARKHTHTKTHSLIILNCIHNQSVLLDLIKYFTAALAKREKLCNYLSVIMICLAIFHVCRRPWANEHFFA
jgi:hypothetical protein